MQDKKGGTFQCLHQDGIPCTKDSECSGGVCFKGSCYSKKGLAAPCNMDDDCASGNCSLGVCQQKGMVSHAEGGTCNLGRKNDVAFCNAGLSCYPSSVSSVIGVCMDSPLSMGDSCKMNGSKCSGALECISEGTFQPCTDKSSNWAHSSVSCTCRLPFPDPRVANEAKICAGPNTWKESAGRCKSNTGAPCLADADCLSGFCVGNPVIVRYELKEDIKHKTSLVMAIETYAPKNFKARKYRSYVEISHEETYRDRENTSTLGSEGFLINIILGQDGRIYYSNTDALSKVRRGIAHVEVRDDYAGIRISAESLNWTTVVSVADGHFVDFDCTNKGRLLALADLSLAYGTEYKSALTISEGPHIESKLAFHSSTHYNKICVENSTKRMFLLHTDGVSVAYADPPAYLAVVPYLVGLSKGISLTDIYSISTANGPTLFGLTSQGVILGKMKSTSYSYPLGVFGSKWTAVVNSCDMASRKTTGGANKDILISSKCTMSETSGKGRSVQALALQVRGKTWLLPGPGGYDPQTKNVAFDAWMHMSETGVARVLFSKSCVPSKIRTSTFTAVS